ncbi:MAG: hypothetical protein QOH39_24 [Verrucomicrobiota bacterium]
MRSPIAQRAHRVCYFRFRLRRYSRRLSCLTTLLLALEAGVILPPRASFAAGTAKRVDPKIEVAAEGASVPMLEIGGRPVVEVRINGKGPFPFILDTGATQTVIDSGLSDELSSSSGDSARIKELFIGSIKVSDLEADSGPITAMFGKIDKPPRGVLSAQSFPGYLLTFDYPRKKITLRKGALPKADARTILSYGADEMLPIVPVKIAGREVKVHLDTGAPFAVSLPTKYKDQLPLTAPAEEKGKARSNSGEFPIFKGTVKGEITIGEYKLATHEMVFTDVVPYPGATPQGQVGYAALRDFAVTLDSANRRVEFAKDATEASTRR